jgi:hypothetical protein
MKFLHVVVGRVVQWLNHGDDVVECLLLAISLSNACCRPCLTRAEICRTEVDVADRASSMM